MKVYVVEETRPILDEDGQEAFISHIDRAYSTRDAARHRADYLIAAGAVEGEAGTDAQVHEMEVQQ